jgi:hypothetical protein
MYATQQKQILEDAIMAKNLGVSIPTVYRWLPVSGIVADP